MATPHPNKILAGMGQQLMSGSTEEISKLAEKKGSTLPTTPLDGAAIGANPDQQKMLGGEPNIRNAFKLAAGGQSESDVSLADVERRGKREEKKADKSAESMSAELTTLTSLQGRVNAAIQSQMGAFSKAIGGVATKVDTNYVNTALVGISDADKKSIVDDANTIIKPSTTTNADAKSKEEADKISALARIKAKVGAQDINKIFGVDSDSWAKNVADKIVDYSAVKFGDVAAQALGTDKAGVDSLKNALIADMGLKDDAKSGKTAAQQLDEMSFETIKQKAQEAATKRYADVPTMKQLVSDPVAPKAMKEMANARLAELGQSGAIAKEASQRPLLDLLKKDETVKIGDKSYTIREFLSDDSIAQSILDYNNADDKTKAQMELNLQNAGYGGFVDILKKNPDAMKEFAKNLQGYSDKLQTRIDTVKSAGKLGDVDIPENVRNVLFPGLSNEQLKTGEIDLDSYLKTNKEAASSPFYAALKDWSDDPGVSKANIDAVVNSLSVLDRDNPGILNWVKGLAKENIGVFLKGGFEGAANSFQLVRGIAKGDLTDPTTLDKLIDDTFGGDVQRLNEFQGVPIKEAGLTDQEKAILDSDGNGVIDSAEGIKTNIAKMMSKYTTDGERFLFANKLPSLLNMTNIASKVQGKAVDYGFDKNVIEGISANSSTAFQLPSLKLPGEKDIPKVTNIPNMLSSKNVEVAKDLATMTGKSRGDSIVIGRNAFTKYNDYIKNIGAAMDSNVELQLGIIRNLEAKRNTMKTRAGAQELETAIVKAQSDLGELKQKQNMIGTLRSTLGDGNTNKIINMNGTDYRVTDGGLYPIEPVQPPAKPADVLPVSDGKGKTGTVTLSPTETDVNQIATEDKSKAIKDNEAAIKEVWKTSDAEYNKLQPTYQTEWQGLSSKSSTDLDTYITSANKNVASLKDEVNNLRNSVTKLQVGTVDRAKAEASLKVAEQKLKNTESLLSTANTRKVQAKALGDALYKSIASTSKPEEVDAKLKQAEGKLNLAANTALKWNPKAPITSSKPTVADKNALSSASKILDDIKKQPWYEASKNSAAVTNLTEYVKWLTKRATVVKVPDSKGNKVEWTQAYAEEMIPVQLGPVMVPTKVGGVTIPKPTYVHTSIQRQQALSKGMALDGKIKPESISIASTSDAQFKAFQNLYGSSVTGK